MSKASKHKGLIEKWIECFSTGTLTDSSGNTKVWTVEDLKTIAQTYNDKLATGGESFEAPIVKGHPETDDPAYGWTRELRYKEITPEDGILEARIAVQPAFAEEVKVESYKKVSIALYDDLSLRHIGFLGAVPPAVKGLEPVKFNRDDIFITYYFEEAMPNQPEGNGLETIKQSALERSQKYGIGLKDGIGYLDKPTAYSELQDDAFADPVNYLYPISDKANFLASWSLFNDWSVKEQYKLVERQIILTRFLSQAESFGIEITSNKLYFSEFSIQEKENLKREKPNNYAEHGTDDFGDPTHFRFPVKSKAECKASLAIFSRKNVQSQYSEQEQQYIAARLIRSAANHGIELTADNWAFAEFMNIPVPVEMLSKTQLVKVVSSQAQSTNSNTNQPGEKFMDLNSWLDGFIAAMTKKISENSNEEIATQFQAWCEEYKTATPPPTGESTTEGSGEGTTASEPIPSAFAEKFKRLEALEYENRMMKFNAYIDDQTAKGQIVPKQKDVILMALEATHTAKPKMSLFSENKTHEFAGEEIIKKVIESFPTQIELAELATKETSGKGAQSSKFNAPEGSVVDPARMELHEKTMQFRETKAKEGVNLTYVQALQSVMQNV